MPCFPLSDTVYDGLVGRKGLSPKLEDGWDSVADSKYYDGGMFSQWAVDAMSETWIGTGSPE